MNTWSSSSRTNLNTVHFDLQLVFNRVLTLRDCSVITGHRNQIEQDRLFEMGPSITTKAWPDSRHNSMPSVAIDVCPYPPGDWSASDEAFREFGQFVLGVAHGLSVELEWGGFWKQPYDPAHFQLANWPR